MSAGSYRSSDPSPFSDSRSFCLSFDVGSEGFCNMSCESGKGIKGPWKLEHKLWHTKVERESERERMGLDTFFFLAQWVCGFF